MYGPVRTVVWQGSVGDRCPYADQILLSSRKNLKAGRAPRQCRAAQSHIDETTARIYPERRFILVGDHEH